MLSLEPISEGILFQCEGCQHVGELTTDIIEDEGTFFCWSCREKMNRRKGAEIEPVAVR